MEKIQISLAAARVNAEMTQLEVAKAMQVDRSTVIRWEKSEKIPNYDECEKLANLYGIPLDCIFLAEKLAKSEKNAVLSYGYHEKEILDSIPFKKTVHWRKEGSSTNDLRPD